MSDKQDTREMLVSGNVFKSFGSGPCKTACSIPAARVMQMQVSFQRSSRKTRAFSQKTGVNNLQLVVTN